MDLQFANPLWLLAAAPLLAHLFWMARRLRMLTRTRRAVAVGVRALVILAIVGALAGTRVARLARDLTIIFAVDRSDSIPELQKKHETLFVQQAVQSMDRLHEKGGIIVFGGEAAVEQPAVAQPEFIKQTAVVDAARTNLADAIQLALASLPEASQKRIVLLSDGNANAGDAEAAARTAAAAHVPIDVLPLPYETRNDIIVEKATIDPRVSVDEPFQLHIVATTKEKSRAKLSVTEQGRLLVQEDVHLVPGRKNAIDLSTRVTTPGFHQFEVQIDAPGDAVPENNRAFAFTYGQGEPRVLLVDGDDRPSDVLPAMLRSEKIDVQRVAPPGMPGTLRELQTYDGVIFNNVGASEISGDQMKMIERAEHDLGMGFIMIGGEHSFGAGGYKDTPIERILPVDMDLKNQKIMPKGALITILHTVEIPGGQTAAVQIADSALNVLAPNDMMGVVYYSHMQGESWLFPLQEVGDKSAMHALIQGIQPGDMPSFDRTLQMSYAALVASKASVKHIVIISDGDPQTPNPALVQSIQAAKITISTVCINPHHPRDSDVMRAVAQAGNGNFYFPQDYLSLPQIFIKEAQTVRKSMIYEEDFTPAIKQYSPILAGFAAYPVLKGYVGTSPKNLADVPLETQHQDPLLAHWRHGLGKTVAFTSDAKELWGTQWTQWNQFAKFWAQTVRWSLRSTQNPNFQMQMNVDGTRGRIVVDAVDAGGEFKNFLKIGGVVTNPDMSTQDVELRQSAPGRYEGEFTVGKPGVYMFGAEALGMGAAAATEPGAGPGAAAAAENKTGDIITGGTTLSYSPEFQNTGTNAALLARIADMTGGRTLDDKSQVFQRSLAAFAQPTPLWPWLMFAAMMLFLMDVFTRRVIIGWSDVAEMAGAGGRRLGALAARLRPARKEADVVTSQLLKARQSAREETIAPREAEAAQREAFLASLKKVDAAASPLKQAEERDEAPLMAPKKPDEKAPPPPDSFTGQLLKARRRKPDSETKRDEGDSQP